MATLPGPTPGILNGTDLLVYDGTHPILHATDCSLQLSQSSRDASTKASAGWKASLPGQRSWAMTNNGLVALDSAYNLAYLMNLIINRTLVTIYMKTANSGDYYFSGLAWLTSAQLTAPNNNNATYSASFEGTGALSMVVPASGHEIRIVGPPIWQITDGDTIIGVNDLYVADSAEAISVILGQITEVVGKIPITNKGAGTLTITAEDGLLIDGQASIDLITDQSITIFPNDTKFEIIGEYGVPVG